MPTPGPLELVIILVIALLVLGPGKLPDVGAALGKSLREFRKASSDIQDAVKVDTSPLPPDQAPTASQATTVTPVAPVMAAPAVTQAAAATAPTAPAPVAPDAPVAAPPGPVAAATAAVGTSAASSDTTGSESAS
jgi:TatA/E family protein of Tat protein translocase